MKAKAADLCTRSLESLRALFSVKTFREMPVGAVLVYDTPRTHQALRASTGTTDASWVVSFTTSVNDKEESGEVYVPSRYAERLQQEPAGIIIYGGMRKSKSTQNDYYVLEFLNPEEAARVSDP